MGKILNLLERYFSLYSHTDDKVKIAVWAATIATITALMNFIVLPLVKQWQKRNSQVQVEVKINYNFIKSAFGVAIQPPLLTLTVTNLTEKTIFIDKPWVSTIKEVNGNDNFHIVTLDRPQFPYKIESGARFAENFSSELLHREILTHLNLSDTIAFKVRTTVGKIYASNILTRQEIEMQMKVSVEVNRRNQN